VCSQLIRRQANTIFQRDRLKAVALHIPFHTSD